MTSEPTLVRVARVGPDGTLGTAFISIEPEPTITEVPETISRAQARVTLLDAGLLDQADKIIRAVGDRRLLIWWEDAGSFRRASPNIATFAEKMGLSPEQVDALFIRAAKERG